jgi:ribosomal protein L11 methylase PrmA
MNNSPSDTREPSSFRDNRGFVFWRGGAPFRRITDAGVADYRLLMSSGLYADLTARGLLLRHEEVEDADGGLVIKPTVVPFVSYPYEWSFSQLQDAALVTLEIQKSAMRLGLTLRDASSYNIQFVGGRPVLIDTLSFGALNADEPWAAYRQFCQHFLAPLALMSTRGFELQQLLRSYIDGVPLSLAARLLPARAKWRPGLASHIVLHAGFQKKHESTATRPTTRVGATQREAVLDSLERTTRGLHAPGNSTEWGDYYNHADAAFEAKKQLVGEALARTGAKTVADLGANDGPFSRVAAAGGARVLSCDIDPVAVEKNYRRVRAEKETAVLPLLLDLTNPSGNLGWANSERASFTKRAAAQTDAVLALALIHHLAISNNLPFDHIAKYFSELAPWLVIEFVPKSDSQVKILLATREDIFPEYNEDGLETAFTRYYDIVDRLPVIGSERTLYLMKRREEAL